MSKPKYQYNTKCLNCEEILFRMVRVGALVFCPKCFHEIFHTDDPVMKERETYLEWLKIYEHAVQTQLYTSNATTCGNIENLPLLPQGGPAGLVGSSIRRRLQQPFAFTHS